MGQSKIDTVPTFTKVGDFNGAGLGANITVGDLNADKKKDLVVLGYNVIENYRYVKIFYGSSGFTLDTANVFFREDTSHFVGAGDIGAFDITGDSIDDLIFRQRDGIIRIWKGGIDFSSKDFSKDGADFIIPPPPDATGFGYALANAGDMNGDGYNDLVVGAPLLGSQTGDGIVFVYSGGRALNDKFDGARVLNSLWGRYGWSVDGAGDMNGDGLSDIVSGGPNYDIVNPQRGIFTVLKGDTLIPHITGIQDIQSLPEEIRLYQNYPNPFNPETTLRYELMQRAKIELIIYNLLGSEIRKLVEGVREAGTYEVRWDGKDQHAKSVASGVYLYSLSINNVQFHRKMILLH